MPSSRLWLRTEAGSNKFSHVRIAPQEREGTVGKGRGSCLWLHLVGLPLEEFSLHLQSHILWDHAQREANFQGRRSMPEPVVPQVLCARLS